MSLTKGFEGEGFSFERNLSRSGVASFIVLWVNFYGEVT